MKELKRNSMSKYVSEKIIETKNGRVRVATVNAEKSRTQQQFKEQVDVNNIVAKYKKTGEWLHLTRKNGVYADVSNITDYRESLDKVMQANAAFASLPSSIRVRFDNDPNQLLNFLQDPNNYQEAVNLRLIDPKPDDANKTNLNDITSSDGKTKKTKTPPPQPDDQ